MDARQPDGGNRLVPRYETYKRQKCFVAYTEQADWSEDLLNACTQVLSQPELNLEPDDARKHFEPDVPLRQKALDLIANARYGIYDLSSWPDEAGAWHMPSNVFIELGMAIALNRPIVLLRHASNQELELPEWLKGTSEPILEFSGETTLIQALETHLPQWLNAPPESDWWNRYCNYGGRVCEYRKSHPKATELGQEAICCHISDGPDLDRVDFRNVVEQELGRYGKVEALYFDEPRLNTGTGYDFLVCTYCQIVRSTPFAIYRITPRTVSETFLAIGMSIALEAQYRYKIPKILFTERIDHVPSLLSGYEVFLARSDRERRQKLRAFLPSLLQKLRETVLVPKPLPYVEVLPGQTSLTDRVSDPDLEAFISGVLATAVVQLHDMSGKILGTGFVTEGGLIITTRHNLDSDRTSELIAPTVVIPQTGEERRTTVIAESAEHDLTVLRAEGGDVIGAQALTLSRAAVIPASSACVYGFSAQGTLGVRCYASGTTKALEGASGLQLEVSEPESTLRGLGGSPVVDVETREVIGIFHSFWRDPDGSEIISTAYAVPAKDVLDWLAEVHDSASPEQPSLAVLDVEDRARLLEILLTIPRVRQQDGLALLLSESDLSTLIANIKLYSTPRQYVGELVRQLESSGILREGETALGRFLAALLGQVELEERILLEHIIAKYRLLPRPPLLLVISGPAAAGKDSVLQRMKERGYAFHFVVTATDRPPRPFEVHGTDYYFYSTAEFERMIQQGELLEHARVYGQSKGIPKSQVREALASGQDVVMRLDVQGAMTVKELIPAAVTIFLTAGSEEELVARLRERRSEPEELLQRRLEAIREEMAMSSAFDHTVINRHNRLDDTVDRILEIVLNEKSKPMPVKIVI